MFDCCWFFWFFNYWFPQYSIIVLKLFFLYSLLVFETIIIVISQYSIVLKLLFFPFDFVCLLRLYLLPQYSELLFWNYFFLCAYFVLQSSLICVHGFYLCMQRRRWLTKMSLSMQEAKKLERKQTLFLMIKTRYPAGCFRLILCLINPETRLFLTLYPRFTATKQ